MPSTLKEGGFFFMAFSHGMPSSVSNIAVVFVANTSAAATGFLLHSEFNPGAVKSMT
jgi:hypothetical protein